MKQEPQGENTFRSMLGVLAGIVGALVLAATLNNLLASGKAPRDIVDQQFSDSASGRVLHERFAADYEAALSKLAPDHALGLYERWDRASEIAASIRTKYSQFAGRANDAALREVVETRVTLLRYISDKKGALACARLLKEGSDFMLPIPAHIADRMDAMEAALMTAMADGRDNPVNRKAVYPEDWQALDASLIGRGVSRNQIDQLQNETVHEDDCRIAISYYTALASFPGEAGERVRSYTIDSWALPS